jgi:ATP-binding cassette subfamily B (MDR/TAP) protein 1
LNIHWVRSHFGLVSQEPILFNLTIAENIAYGLENVSVEAIIDAASKANIHQFIQQLPQVKLYKTGLYHY